ncbi:MAG TPA: ferritin-like domain-containing protein [Candidatus Binatia bacterium]|nr:ferritin-like domain-containing protein [Candidatus Binatia bacterium]
MTLRSKWLDTWRKLLGVRQQARTVVLHLLRHRYVKEKQHAMRCRQHAERMCYPQFREVLVRIATEEEKHADLIGAKLQSLGEKLPDVIPIHFAKEQNTWSYLRTDLMEEQRCAAELEDDLLALHGEFPEIAEFLGGMASDGKRHREQLRALLARSDPQSAGPA